MELSDKDFSYELTFSIYLAQGGAGMRGPKPKCIDLQVKERKILRQHLRTGKTEWRMARRAQIMLGLDEGRNPCEVAGSVGCHPSTVARVRDRFEERGLDFIYDAPRSGRPPEIFPPRESSDRGTGLPGTIGRRFAADAMEDAHVS